MARAKFRVTSIITKEIEDFYAETEEQAQEILDEDPQMWDTELIENARVEILEFEGDKPDADQTFTSTTGSFRS